MAKIELNNFLKKIDPEFRDITEELLERLPNGYLLDNDDGLKKHCNCDNLKSVDFLLEKDGNLYFTEFSDLNSEDGNIREKIKQQINCCEQAKSCPVKGDYPKLLQNIKVNDFALKYKDTLLLLLSIKNDLEPKTIFHENTDKWHFLIVYNKKPNLDLVRYLDLLKSNIKSSLPTRLLNKDNFKIQNLDNFINNF